MNQIIEKINKLLALGERGGTEAEATAAMQKVHELLAKHNLSLDDVKALPVAEEDYVREEAESSARQPWQDWVWASVADLYFCKHFKLDCCRFSECSSGRGERGEQQFPHACGEFIEGRTFSGLWQKCFGPGNRSWGGRSPTAPVSLSAR